MNGHRHCQVVTTTDSERTAQELARGAVTARVAACAQVEGPITSSYWWQGSVESASEWRVTFKTTAGAYSALEHYLRQAHNYDVPEILCTPVTAGNPAYLAWIDAETLT